MGGTEPYFPIHGSPFIFPFCVLQFFVVVADDALVILVVCWRGNSTLFCAGPGVAVSVVDVEKKRPRPRWSVVDVKPKE